MNKKYYSIPVILSLLIILGGIGLSSCAPAAPVQSQGEVETYINTAVSATLVQYIIETKVAAEAIQEPAELIAQVQPTETPLPPTPTLVPTIAPTVQSELPAPTSVPTAEPPQAAAPATLQISADLNTNCRYGPGKVYSIIGTFLKGTTAVVHGRDSTRNWWYIDHPNKTGQFCWVWDGSTTIQGDPSGIQVVDAPEDYTVKTSSIYYYDDENGWYQTYYNDYPQNTCGVNPWYSCGYPINWSDSCGCKNSKINCYPYPIKVKWDPCQPYTNQCKCVKNWTNPCKKSKCPAVTIVNINNYCKKYPQCCE